MGSRALLSASDAGNLEAQSELARSIGKAFGKLDIRIVSAGIADMRPLEKWDEGGFDRSFDIKVKASFSCAGIVANLCQTCLDRADDLHQRLYWGTHFKRLRGIEGRSSFDGGNALMRIDLPRNSGECSEPGPIATPLYDKLGLAPADLKAMSESVNTQIPAARFGSPEEIANAIVFLASDEAACKVGSELVIDGGMSNL